MKTPFVIRPMTEDDLEQLFRIRQIAFFDNTDTTDPSIIEHHLKMLPYRYGCFIDGELASTATWWPYRVMFYGERRRAAGLASVSTALAHRRKGCVAALLSDGLVRARDEKLAWSFEHPFDPRYYARFGWETVRNGNLFRVPTEHLFTRISSHTTMRQVDPDDENNRARFAEIHAAFAKPYNFMMTRDDGLRDTWEMFFHGAIWQENHRVNVFLGEHAYAILQMQRGPEGQVVDVIDYAYDAPAGRQELFNLLGQFHGQSQFIDILLPSDDPLTMDWCTFAAKHPNSLQARIVDVIEALQMTRPEQAVSFTLDVEDTFCDWNNGVFEVDASPTGTAARATTKRADIELGVGTLARILSGSLDVRNAVRCGLLGGDESAIKALGLLATHACHLPTADYF
jgi:predicted acetyltransferase